MHTDDIDDMEARLSSAGARFRDAAGSVDPGDLRLRAGRRQRLVTGGASIAVLLVVVAVVLAVSLSPSPADESDLSIADGPAGDPTPFGIQSAPATDLFEVGGWEALAPTTWITTTLTPPCPGVEAQMLSSPNTAPPVFDSTTCEPLEFSSAALVVVTQAETGTPDSSPTTAVGDVAPQRIASGPGPDGYQTVHVFGDGADSDLLRRSATAPRSSTLAPGTVLEPVERAESAPGAEPLPRYRPGLPDGMGLSDVAGSDTDAQFQLIDTSSTLRARFVTVCASAALEPGSCSGDPGTPMEQRTSVASDGVDWMCADPFACISATPLDVDGRERFVTITVDLGLLSVEDVTSILEWTPRG